MVQDPTILDEVDVLEGLKEGGTVLINTEKSVSAPPREGFIRWVVVPASRIAVEVLGRSLMNTALCWAPSGKGRGLT
jgi:hypothetical protein